MAGGVAGLKAIPTVDWRDVERDRQKFLADLRFALAECGFMILTHAPGSMKTSSSGPFGRFGLFDAPRDFKKTAHIANSPYFRGYTVPTRRIGATGRSSKIFSTASSRRPWPPRRPLRSPL